MKHIPYTENDLKEYGYGEYELLKYYVLEKEMSICKNCGLDINSTDEQCMPSTERLFSQIK